MEFEKIISSVKEKIGETNLSDRTISDYVKQNLPTEGTEPDEAYFARHASVLKSLNGQYSHDLAKAVEDFKKNYKPAGTPPAPPSPKDNKELAELTARIAKMEAEAQAQAKVFQSERMKRELMDKASELKVSSKHLWNDIVSSVSVENFKTTDEALTNIKAEYEAKLSRYSGGNTTPYGREKGSGADTEKEMEKRREAYRKTLEEDDGNSAP